MPKTVDHDAYRKELLKRCFDLFGRKGFSNVTMREIATEIGVSTGALYHYFPTKVSILEQMFSWAVEVDAGDLGRTAGMHRPLPERLARLTDFWLRDLAHYQNLLLLAMDLFRNSAAESEAVFREYAEHYRSAIARTLGSNGRLSNILFTYVLGLVVQSLLIPRDLSSREQRTVVRDAVQSLVASSDGARGARSATGRTKRAVPDRRRRGGDSGQGRDPGMSKGGPG